MIHQSICSNCKRRGKLESRRDEKIDGHPGLVETYIYCTACGRKTHAAWTNPYFEDWASRIRRIISQAQREAELKRYKSEFDAFNQKMQGEMSHANAT